MFLCGDRVSGCVVRHVCAAHIQNAEAVLGRLRESLGLFQIQLTAEVASVLPAIEFAAREYTVTVCQLWVARKKNSC